MEGIVEGSGIGRSYIIEEHRRQRSRSGEEEEAHEPARDRMLPAAEHAVDDVAAVELSHRNHIERRHEHAEPADREKWVVIDLVHPWEKPAGGDDERLQE